MLRKFLLPALLCSSASFAAEAPNPNEAKLREGLRATMLQLRTAETERAALQGEKVAFEETIKTLTEKLETAVKDGENKQKTAEALLADRDQKIANQAGVITGLQESLEKWKASQKQAVALGEATEAKRARAAAEVVVLHRKVADHQTKNAAMFRLGNEILDRYEKFGLGTALTAREPFVGLTRVKFENLMQDYGDKLTGERIKP